MRKRLQQLLAVTAIAGIGLSAYLCVSADAHFRQEQHWAKLVEDAGGQIEWEFVGWDCIPAAVRSRSRFLCERIVFANLSGAENAPELLQKCNGLPWATCLYLAVTPIGDPEMAFIAKLSRLEQLNLCRTKISDAGLRQLGQLTELAELDLQETQITDAGIHEFPGLKRLETLVLNRTSVTDLALEDLAQCNLLERLECRETKTTPAGRSALRRALPNCNIRPDR